MKTKKHTLTVTVEFDEPCSRVIALNTLKRHVSGRFFDVIPSCEYTDDLPEKVQLVSFGSKLK